MATTNKLVAGTAFPSLPITLIGGGTLDPAAMPGWRVLIVYRGKHCPLCKAYFKTLNGLLDEFKVADVAVVAVSADPKDKAEADVAGEGWRFPVGYGLTLGQMRQIGLYISAPRTPPETDCPFAEPGLFAINPDGKLHIVAISNSPSARPDLAAVLRGIKLSREKGYGPRGTLD